MKETSFVNNNKKKWERFEHLSKQKNNDPDEISELFTEITEDLSYARTFYPRRSVRVYLNQIAQGVFTSLYKQKKQPLGGFMKFWKETVPLALYHSRQNLLMALIFFSAAILLGAISQHFDSSFAELILGENYISSTENRIAEGNPMGIYGESEESSMFFRITINNIQVAFFAFVLGITYTFGSYIILLHNGIMLGAFQWWFKSKGLLLTSFLAIWIHGAFEISAIVIAGGAGITLGNGLLFPKSHSRLQSLIFSAKRGMIILVSLVPIFIMAGALESFVTRYYQSIPITLNWLIIIASFAIIILYYCIYPFLVARRNPDKLILQEEPRYIPERKIVLNKIRSTGELFTDTTYGFIQNIKLFSGLSFKFILLPALAIILTIIYLEPINFYYELSWYENIATIFSVGDHFTLYKLLVWGLIMAIGTCVTYYIVHSKPTYKVNILEFAKSNFKSFLWITLFSIAVIGLFTILNWALLIIFFLLLGFVVLLTPIIILKEEVNVFKAISRSFKIVANSYGQCIGNSSAIVFITVIFFFILHNPFEYGILMLINEFLENLLVGNVDSYFTIINGFNSIIYLIFLTYITTLSYTNAYYFYLSLQEKQTAGHLKSEIETIGKRSKTFETKLEFE